MLKQSKSGFTIVELLIVIVVIGVLATITVVAYSGIQKQAMVASIKSNLEQVSKKLELSKISKSSLGEYPSDLASIDVQSDPKLTYYYTADNSSTPPGYCLTIASTDGSVAYHISSSSNLIEEGACVGHDIGGPPVFDNLTWHHGDNAPAFSGDSIDVSTSSDGKKVLVSSNTALNLSQDSGQSWATVGPSNNYLTNDMSSDGKVMIAAGYSTNVYLSKDYGQNWTQQSIGNRVWKGVAVSEDGQKLLAVTDNVVYMSIDGGVSWVSQSSKTGNGSWDFASISANGNSMIIGGDSGAGVVMSSDGGNNWSKVITTNRIWVDAAISDDGLTAYVVYRTGSGISKTTDGGVTWSTISGSQVYGYGIATSSDGTKIAVIGQGPSGSVNTVSSSKDSGGSWQLYTPFISSYMYARSIATSSNGTKLYALFQSQGLYIGQYGP